MGAKPVCQIENQIGTIKLMLYKSRFTPIAIGGETAFLLHTTALKVVKV
jgi:hypothetical protein